MVELNIELIKSERVEDLLGKYDLESMVTALINNGIYEKCFDLIKTKIESSNSSNKDVILYRKKLYDIYVKSKHEIDQLWIINHIEHMISISLDTPKKLNIPFYNIIRSYYLKHDKNKVGQFTYHWKNAIDLKDLHDEPYGTAYYSQREQFFLDVVKFLCFDNKLSEVIEYIQSYEHNYGATIQPNGILFFAYYNLLKAYYDNGLFESAREIHRRLIAIDRKNYLIEMPIKYYDTETNYSVMLLIDILVNEIKTTSYFENVIVKFITKLGLRIDGFIYDMILDDTKKTVLLKDLLIYLHKKYNEVFVHGKIASKSPKGNYFIWYGKESIFVSKKYSKLKIDYSKEYLYVLVDSYDKKKNQLSKIAVLLDLEE